MIRLIVLCLSTIGVVSDSLSGQFGSRIAFSRGVKIDNEPKEVASLAAFGIPRGGGLFGSNKQKDKSSNEFASNDPSAPKYPPMSREEIEAWLEHIPVFAVTDEKGQGVVLRPQDNPDGVFYFFMSPTMANQTLTALRQSTPQSSEMDLRISAFSLGKIWFNILNAGPDKKVILKEPGAEDGKEGKGVDYRLIPNDRDLMGARMLLTMKPEDSEKLRNGQQMTPEMAQAAFQKAMTESPKFNATYNEIPVFIISQMRMQKQQEQQEEEATPANTILPMYFSLQDMVGTWQQYMSNAPDEYKGMEPNINLMSLHDLVGLMQTESPIDFRNVLLVPSSGSEPTAGRQGAAAQAATTMPSNDPIESMNAVMGGGSGSTLADI